MASDRDESRGSTREADRRYKLARAKREERKNQEEAGPLVPREELMRNRLELIKGLVGVLEGLPAAWAPEIAGKVWTIPAAQTVIRDRLDDHRRYLVASSAPKEGNDSQ